MDVNFEDVAITFSQEEWGLLAEAQRHLYCNTMLEAFALVSSVEGEEACSEQCASVRGESQIRTCKTAPATQRTLLCTRCVSMLKDILRLTASQATYFEQKASPGDTCGRGFCFGANPHQPRQDSSGEKPWQGATDGVSFMTSFYVSELPSENREVGVDLHASSGFLQHQKPLRGTEISQAFPKRKSHGGRGEDEKAASHVQDAVPRHHVCAGDAGHEARRRGDVLSCAVNLHRRRRRRGVHTRGKSRARVDRGKEPSHPKPSSLARPDDGARTRGKSVECRECGKWFRCNSLLLKHTRVHTGEKPYPCGDCGRSFGQTSHLVQHRRVHTGEKPFECPDCGKAFSHRSTLAEHQTVHTGEKPYTCGECGKSFRSNSHFRYHRRVHTGEKPYACEDCGKSFRQNSALTEHQRVHTGERPYACGDCGKYFGNVSNLIKHHRVHTGERPHECTECGKSFCYRSALLRHLSVHTGERL